MVTAIKLLKRWVKSAAMYLRLPEKSVCILPLIRFTVLRLDVKSEFETAGSIASIMRMIVPNAFDLFDCEEIITKAPTLPSSAAGSLLPIHMHIHDFRININRMQKSQLSLWRSLTVSLFICVLSNQLSHPSISMPFQKGQDQDLSSPQHKLCFLPHHRHTPYRTAG